MTEQLPPQKPLRDRIRVVEPITFGRSHPDENLTPHDVGRIGRLDGLDVDSIRKAFEAEARQGPQPYWPVHIHPGKPELHIARMGRFTWHAYIVTETMAALPASFAWTRKRAVAKALRKHDRWKNLQRLRETIPLEG